MIPVKIAQLVTVIWNIGTRQELALRIFLYYLLHINTLGHLDAKFAHACFPAAPSQRPKKERKKATQML